MSNCKTISVCNQKGGVGKTTTTVNLGVGLAMQGKKVLLIDADPQGDLTTCLGWQDTDSLGITLATKLTDVINETMTDPMVGILHHEEGVDLVPANLELSAMEFNLVNAMSRETTLKNYLSQVKNRYDYVIIDCMPSLGMVTLNALSAADSVIIPVQAQYLPASNGVIYKDVCNPITAEFREELYTNILDAYARIKEPEKEETQKQDRTQEMPEFSVTVTPYEREGSNIKGLARIYFENSFIVNNINIVQGKEKIFVSMPSYKTKQVDEQGKPIYQDVCYPVTKDFREKLYNEIISEYEKAKDKSNEKARESAEKHHGNPDKEKDKEATPFR